MLQKSAMDAVQKWTYSPYLINGQPVEVQTTINVNYTFGGDDAKPSQPDGPGASADPAPRDAIASTDAEGQPVRRIGGGVSAPVVIHNVPPEFSDEARARAKQEGKDSKVGGAVLVQLIVNTQGQPENVHVVHGVGMGLDEKALEAVRQYRFLPAMEGGKPVPVALNVEVNFKIF
jgi:TonB family protein